MKYNVFIGTRELPPTLGWKLIIKKSTLVSTMMEHGTPKEVSIKHDLNKEHVSKHSNRGRVHYNELYKTFTHETGLHYLFTIVDFCKENNTMIEELYIRGDNVAGNQNLEDLAINSGVFKKITYI